MSRVNIGQVYCDLYERQKDDACNIEIVPRKMVEMIIEKCDERIAAYRPSGYIAAELKGVKEYAESLLEKFEESDKDEWQTIL
jgi:hypothetical protein